jgi:hypothetical protein
MPRPVLRWSVIILLAAVSLAWSEQEAKPPARKLDSKEPDAARDARGKLARQIALANGIDANTPLKDALDFLAQQVGLAILIDPGAAQILQAEGMEIGAMPVQLPKMQGVKLAVILRMLAEQTGTTYLIKPGHVEITVPQRANPMFWVPPYSRQDSVKMIPTVQAEFDKRPLDQALRELSEATGITIILDGRTSDVGRTPVTATLNEVPIDTAVILLADMCGLKAVHLDKALYVTNPTNAAALQADLNKLRGID